jgi:hypothetical protein
MFVAVAITSLQAQPQSDAQRTEHQTYSENGYCTANISICGPLLPEFRQSKEQPPTYNLQWNAYPDKNPSGFLWIPWDGWVAIFTLVLAGVSIWQGFQIKKGERLTLAALRSSQQQSRASIKAANSADKTVRQMEETAEQQLRAYIHIESIAVTALKSRDPSGRTIFRNAGQTPAYEVRSHSRMVIREFPLDFDLAPLPGFNWDAPNESRNPLGPRMTQGKQTTEMTPPAGPDEFALLDKKDVAFYMYGEIQYKDIFGKDRYTRWLYFVGGPNPLYGEMASYPVGNDAN